MTIESLESLFNRAECLLERLERHLLTPDHTAIDWSQSAFRWRRQGQSGTLHAVQRPHRVALDDLLCMDRQKAEVVRNTAQFVAGRPANNVLLWGARGTGKSTLVKAVFNAYADQGLRLVEVDKAQLIDLPDIVELLQGNAGRCVIYCDDLSFEAEEPGYKSLKAVLEGSISTPPDNVLIYATSNRRHLLPEFQSDNQQGRIIEGELHQGDALEEKISLSERFGLWLSFYPFSQDDYLSIVRHWLGRLGEPAPDAEVEQLAVRWATQRGSRSGRVARQFALDWAGRADRGEA